MADEKTQMGGRWLAFLADLEWEADCTEPPSREDRDYGPFDTPRTQRARYPAQHDYLAEWLDAGDNAARLRVLGDALLPNRVDRLRCCPDVDQRRTRWLDPIDWRAWRGSELHEFEQRRADLLAIVVELRRVVERGGKPLPPFDLPAPVPPAPMPPAAPSATALAAAAAVRPDEPATSSGRWVTKTEAAREADISVERLRPWTTRERNPLPTKWVGGVEMVNLDDVVRERDAKDGKARPHGGTRS